MLLLSNNKKELLKLREDINNFLINKLKLELCDSKDKLGEVRNGINFLGYIVSPKYKLSRRRVVSNLKNKLYFFNKGYLLPSNNQKQLFLPLSKNITDKELGKITATINSYYGHFRHADTYRLRVNLFTRHLGILSKYLKQKGDYSHVEYKK